MYKILVSCANGAGSSLMLKMNVEKVFKSMGLDIAKIHHCSISEGKSSARQYDMVFTPLNFISMFKEAEDAGVTVIGLRNVLSKVEIEEKIRASGILDK